MQTFCPRCSAYNSVDKTRPGAKNNSQYREVTDKYGNTATIITCSACGYEFDPTKPNEINFDPKQTSDVKNRRAPAILVRVIAFTGVFFCGLATLLSFSDSKGTFIAFLLLTIVFLFVGIAIKVPPKRKWNKNTKQGSIL